MKKLKLLLLLTAMGTVLLSGCSGKKGGTSAEDVLTKMQAASKDYKSAEMGINMSVTAGTSGETDDSAEAVSYSFEISGTSQVVLDPETSKMEGTMKMNYAGQEQELPLTVYTVKEDDGQYTTYTYDETAGWYKTTAETAEYDYSSMMDYEGLKELASSFELSKETVDVDGVECHELTGTLTGEDIKAFYSDYESMGLADDSLKDYSIDLTISVEKETYRPKVMHFALNASEEAEMPMTMVMDLTFNSYDSVDSIEIPEEAKAAQDLGSLYSE